VYVEATLIGNDTCAPPFDLPGSQDAAVQGEPDQALDGMVTFEFDEYGGPQFCTLQSVSQSLSPSIAYY
jgi:hypothetical protein